MENRAEDWEYDPFYAHLALCMAFLMMVGLYVLWVNQNSEESPCKGIYNREALGRCLHRNR